jgi:uncharacterized membrane protein HdeD (DUF308 family)
MNNTKSLWGLELFAGLVWILLGSAALFLPVITTISVVFIFGWILIIGGIFQCLVVLYDWTAAGGMQFMLGILSLIFGSVLVMHVFSGAVAITSMIGILFLLQGMLMLVAGLFTGKKSWYLIISGSISFVAALLVLGNLIASSLFLVGLLLGVQMIMTGFALIADATFEANDAGRVRQTLGWLLVIVIGVLLFASMFDRPEPRDTLEGLTDASEAAITN